MLHVDQTSLEEERTWSRAACTQKIQDSYDLWNVFPKQLQSASTPGQALHPVGAGVLGDSVPNVASSPGSL